MFRTRILTAALLSAATLPAVAADVPTSVAPDPAAAMGEPDANPYGMMQPQLSWPQRGGFPANPTPNDIAAWENMSQTMLPMPPQMIEALRTRYDMTLRAAAQPPRIPSARTGSMDVALEPGGQPPTVNLSAGNVTSLSFYDVTGQAWPVAAVVVGNPNSFDVQIPSLDGNLVTVSPLGPYARGNLSVSLRGQPMPIVVNTQAGYDKLDALVNFRVPTRGPNAQQAVLLNNSAPIAGDSTLGAFIDGTPPDGSEVLTIKGGPASAWRFGGSVYIRTTMTMLSPGWVSSASGAGNVKVYQMPDTPVMLASDDGRTVTLKLDNTY